MASFQTPLVWCIALGWALRQGLGVDGYMMAFVDSICLFWQIRWSFMYLESWELRYGITMWICRLVCCINGSMLMCNQLFESCTHAATWMHEILALPESNDCEREDGEGENTDEKLQKCKAKAQPSAYSCWSSIYQLSTIVHQSFQVSFD